MTITEEGRINRNCYIGGSDVASIMGMNPYKSKNVLFKEKTGQKEAGDAGPLANLGTKLEPHIFAYLRFTHATDKDENQTIKHKKYPYMMGHVDGWDKSENFVEVKTHYILDMPQDKQDDHEKKAREKMRGLISYEKCQMQFYMHITKQASVNVHKFLFRKRVAEDYLDICDIDLTPLDSDIFEDHQIHGLDYDPIFAKDMEKEVINFWQMVQDYKEKNYVEK